MKMSGKRKKLITAIPSLIVVLLVCSIVQSHCQIPCGIYDDDARFNSIAEHITTIEKSMKLIEELSNQDVINANQIVRWVNNKEEHADELSHIITYYFMAQRIKSAPEGNVQEYKNYVKKLTLLHEMLVTTMKAKQTTDTANVTKLRTLLSQFHVAYTGKVASGEHPH